MNLQNVLCVEQVFIYNYEVHCITERIRNTGRDDYELKIY